VCLQAFKLYCSLVDFTILSFLCHKYVMRKKGLGRVEVMDNLVVSLFPSLLRSFLPSFLPSFLLLTVATYSCDDHSRSIRIFQSFEGSLAYVNPLSFATLFQILSLFSKSPSPRNYEIEMKISLLSLVLAAVGLAQIVSGGFFKALSPPGMSSVRMLLNVSYTNCRRRLLDQMLGLLSICYYLWGCYYLSLRR
jgi:hypothetical protein